MAPRKNACNVRNFIPSRSVTSVFHAFFLVLYLLFAYNVANSNGVLRWHDVEDFLSQCGDHPPEELHTLFQNVIPMEYFRINNALFHSSSVTK